MLSYQAPVDICNTALQFLGVQRINSLGDNSKNASEMNFAYDKKRQAELRRNNWRFAMRTVALRPINSLANSTGQTSATTSWPTPAYLSSGSPPVGVSMYFMPPLYDPTVTYALGAIVADGSNTLWQSMVPNNLNGNFTTQWTEYFGSLIVSPYDTTGQTAYFPNELVYETQGPGAMTTYLTTCYTSGADPAVPTPYVSTVIYYTGQVVKDTNGILYMCIQNGTVGIDPASEPTWDATTNYVVGQTVGAFDGFSYTALQNSTGVNPTGNGFPATWSRGGLTAWTISFSQGLGSECFQALDCRIAPLNIVYPVGTGPAWQASTKNVFMLPNGFLKTAPQDPKAGANSFLGAPSGNQYSTWDYVGNFILTQLDQIIVLRFIADVNEVPTFDPMFCEGLAARLAMDLCEPITQAQDKWQRCSEIYGTNMREAREANGIQCGPTEPPEDDYVSCRY